MYIYIYIHIYINIWKKLNIILFYYLIIFLGEWKDDKKHGMGEFRWVEGDSYIGLIQL
jgi:hypothetical protein